jgi:D-serine deaminase-like pyridoxal phosphate-dependent protein
MDISSINQTPTPWQTTTLPNKGELRNAFVGKSISELRTPAFIVDRAVFAQNCAKMHERAKKWDAAFRAHVKTHKTTEGTRMQLISNGGRSSSIVVSTLMEAWQVAQSGLVADGIVTDILYGLPIAPNKIQDAYELSETLRKSGAVLRLLIDDPDQVLALQAWNAKVSNNTQWSAFVKVDFGYKRAGVVPSSPRFQELLRAIAKSNDVSIFGFYCHAGNSYGSKSLSEASSFLSTEVESVNEAAKLASELLGEVELTKHNQPFVLSVGATPTAHAFSETALAMLKSLLHGDLELHAGNYPMLDMQQVATSLVERKDIAQRVVASVVSYYPGRGVDRGDEAMCDAGAIALSKDTGPFPGYGNVVRAIRGSTKNGTERVWETAEWRLGRISQEHGVLVQNDGVEKAREEDRLRAGDLVEVVCQHACLAAAAFPWFYVVESGSEVGSGHTVVDVWVPWKGW